ncbi:MAG: TrmB family transcriptional regulator [Patescibacteria group bacterium]
MQLSLEQLNLLDLSENQLNIYTTLLEHESLSATQLATSTKLKRPTVYRTLEELHTKELIEKLSEHAVVRFRAKHPYALKQYSEKRIQDIRTTNTTIDALLPDLIHTYETNQNKPGIQVYDSIEDIKKAYLSLLEPNSEILATFFRHPDGDLLENFWEETYHPTAKKKNVSTRSLVVDGPRATEYQSKDIEHNRKSRILPADKFPLTMEKNISPNKVLYVSPDPQKLLCVIIESKAIAESERLLFEPQWEQAKTHQ